MFHSLQRQQHHYGARGASFAALNTPFSSLAEAGAKKRRKKKKVAKAVDTPEQGNPAAGTSAADDTAARKATNAAKNVAASKAAKGKKAAEAARQQEREGTQARIRREKQEREDKERLKREREEAAARDKVQADAEREQEKKAAAARKEEEKLLKEDEKARANESEFVRALDFVEEPPGPLPYDWPLGVHSLEKGITPEVNETFMEMVREDDVDDVVPPNATMESLLRREQKQKELRKMGAGEPGVRNKPWEQIYHEKDINELRADAPKMELRPDDHDALGLDRIGRGLFYHPKKLFGRWTVGAVPDFAWGMFASIPRLRKRLAPKWAGLPPDDVMQQQEFYHDILNVAPEVELTLQLVARRDFPLAEARNKFLDEQQIMLRRVMYQEWDLEDDLEPRHQLMLSRIKKAASVEYLKDSGLIDKEGNIRKNSQLFLTVTREGALTAQAVTPGSIGEQQTVHLARWEDFAFNRGIMNHFLGLYAKDGVGKTSVGNGVLYVTNGFDFVDPKFASNPNQFYNSPPSEYVPAELSAPSAIEGVTASPDLFSIDTDHPMLVSELTANSGRLHASTV